MAVNKVRPSTIWAIVSKASNLRSREEKIDFLRENNSLALRDVLKGAYDDAIQFILPEGTPPYEKGDERAPAATLMKTSKQFRYFVSGGPGESLPKAKIETMFIGMLEGLHPDDAELIILMKEKQLHERFKGLTKKIVADAFPGLISK